MARNTSVTLGDHFTSFINEQVQAADMGPPAMWYGQGFACSKSMRLA